MLSPVVILLMLLSLSLFFLIRKRNALGVFFIALSLAGLFLIAASPFSQWLIQNLEKATTPVDLTKLEETETHILILGSGHSISPSLPPTGQLSSTALLRLVEGIRIYRQLPDSKLVCSGYSASGRTTQAEMMALAAIDLGVITSDTLLITGPSNTSEEAKSYATRFGNKYQLILVTSASHMPRALQYFHRYGLKPVAAPTDYHFKIDLERRNFNFKPSVAKMKMMELALHEYGGLLELWFGDDDQ